MRHEVSSAWAALTMSVMALVFAGCGRVDTPRPGTWRAVADVQGREAPFLLDVASENERTVIYFVRAGSRVRLNHLRLNQGTLTARLPDSSATLTAEMYRDRMQGNIVISDEGAQQEIDFTARRDQNWLFHEESATDNADVSGQWELLLTYDDDDARLTAALSLEQRHDRVTGSLLAPSQERYPLDGQVRGDDLRLTLIAGDAIELYELTVDDQGDLRGKFWRGEKSKGTAHARRNPDGALFEPEVERQ